MVSIVERARRGGLWVAIAQFMTRLSGYGVGIVLARLLSPSDYGLFGMASVVSGFISLIGNVGIGAALTQTKENVHRIANAAFWMNLALAVSLMGLQILVAPLAAQFYSTPAVTRIMQVLALGYVLSALGTVHNTLLARDLRFREQTILQMLVMACSSALFIALAWSGAGAWSLVLPVLLVAPLNLVLLWRIVRWLPQFSFSVPDARKIFRFGRNVFFTDVAGYINNNLDYLLIGRIYGAQPLGIYTFAYKQAMLGLNAITSIVYQVAFPAYSAMRREGRSFEQAHRRSTRAIALVSFPVQLWLLVVAHLYIPLIFSERWSAAVPLFRIMVTYGSIRSIASLGGSAIYAAGKPEIGVRWNIIAMPLMITAILIGSRFGVFGIALATGVMGSILALFFMLFVCRSLGWRYWSLLGVLKPAAVSSAVMMALTGAFLLPAEHWFNQPAVVLVTVVMIGALAYIVALRLLFPDDLKEMFWLVTGKRQSLLGLLKACFTSKSII